MILVGEFTELNETKYQVGYVHHMPFDEVNGLGKTKEELEAEGCILVDNIPEAQNTPNKRSILFVNPITKELWYEYEDMPPTPEELLQAQIDEMSIALAAILGGAQ